MLRKISTIIIFLFLGLAGTASIMKHYFVINITESFPVGLYMKTEPTFQKNELVLFCPPLNEAIRLAYERLYIRAGGCEGDYSYMIKKIAGLPGDMVSIGEDGVFINGRFVENSKQKKLDGAGRPLPRLEIKAYKIPEGEFIVVSDFNPFSFDSRYMGGIEKSSIRAGLRPVFVKF